MKREEKTSNNYEHVISGEIGVNKTMIEPKKDNSLSTDIPKAAELKTEEDHDLKLIHNNLARVQKYGIAILRPMNEDRRKHLHKLVQGIEGISSFEIGDIGDEKVVIRLQKKKEEYICINDIFKECYDAFVAGNYAKEIKILSQLFALKELKSVVYHLLGQCYFKLNKRLVAADYFELAYYTSKNENMQNPKYKVYDYRILIAKLRRKEIDFSPVNDKPYFNINENYFTNDLDDCYGIKQFNQFEHFLSIGISIEEACNILKYDSNTALMALLLVARNHYAYEENDLGDYYCKLVERAKGKSREVKKLLEEVRRNKLFYKNRLVRKYD